MLWLALEEGAAHAETPAVASATPAPWAVSALLAGLLVAGAVFILFIGISRLKRPLDPVVERFRAYGGEADLAAKEPAADEPTPRDRLNRLLGRYSFGARLAADLALADLPLTAAEFALISCGAGLLGFVLGAWRLGPLGGLVCGGILAYLPIVYIRQAKRRRQAAFTNQLPDVITLMVGALRAGYGLSQALQVLVEQLPPPAGKEFALVTRAVNVGMPLQKALRQLAERMATDDVHLIVTAIIVQHEIGGNLAETLEIISETIRDRISIQREIQVLTSEERLTGYLLAGLPAVVAVALSLVNPAFMSRLFDPAAPAWARLLPIVAVLLQFLGFMAIRKIISIEV